MKPWVILAALLPLAGCGEQPRFVLTSAKPHSIQFLVQGARFVPLRDVENRAATYCGGLGLTAHRSQAEWVGASSMTFRFECEDRHKPGKLADKKKVEPHPTAPGAVIAKAPADPKQAAWRQANAMSEGWAKCISDAAAKLARASDDPAEAAAGVVAGCSWWEQDIHRVLGDVGEDDGEFKVALHRQIIEFASARILAVRAAPAAEPATTAQHATTADPRQTSLPAHALR